MLWPRGTHLPRYRQPGRVKNRRFGQQFDLQNVLWRLYLQRLRLQARHRDQFRDVVLPPDVEAVGPDPANIDHQNQQKYQEAVTGRQRTLVQLALRQKP